MMMVVAVVMMRMVLTRVVLMRMTMMMLRLFSRHPRCLMVLVVVVVVVQGRSRIVPRHVWAHAEMVVDRDATTTITTTGSGGSGGIPPVTICRRRPGILVSHRTDSSNRMRKQRR